MHDPTFLHQHETPQVHQRHRRRRFWRSFFVVVCVVVGGWVLLLTLALGQLFAAGLDVRDALVQAHTHVNDRAFDQAQDDVRLSAQALKKFERAFYFVRLLWVFPGLDRDLADLQGTFIATRQLLESVDGLFGLGQDIAQLTDAQENTSFKELSSATKKAILERLSTASDEFDLLSARIHIARTQYNRLRTNTLVRPFLSVMDPMLSKLDVVQGELSVAATLAHILPELSGLGGEKAHLLLFLNNDELRPGGGFIGTYGLLRTQDGEIVSLATKDVYALDQQSEGKLTVTPPAPLTKYNATTNWYLRDANWSPDFAVSAEQVLSLFEQESAFVSDPVEVPAALQVDGVIGFTPTAASALLQLIGPIEVGGQIFTKENVPELIEYQVERGFQENGIPFAQRKEILSQLVVQIQDRLVALPFSQWDEVFGVISEMIASKQIALYSRDASVQKALTTSGWSGVLPQTIGDELLFVDANLASLKTDPVVKRSLRYEVFRNASGVWIGRATMTYDHQGSFDWRTTRYRSYARLYLPLGSTIVRVTGLNEGPEIGEELGRTRVGGFIVIEPGTEKSVVYEYQLSPRVVESIVKQAYTLRVLKQLGARDSALTLDLDFDKNVTHATPGEDRSEWGDDRYRLNTKLSQDLEVEVRL